MKPTAKLLAISVALLTICFLPWWLLGYAPQDSQLINACFVLIAIALLVLLADLIYFKTISRQFGAVVNQSSTSQSFSMIRIGYLLLVYLTPVSAVLALLAWAKTMLG